MGLNKDDVQRMTTQLRQGVVVRKPAPRLDGEVECDEVYVTAGHKGHPEAVKKKAARAVEIALKGPVDAAPWRKRNPRCSA